MHGVSKINTFIKDSKVLGQKFLIDHVSISTSRSVEDIGTSGVRKILFFLKIFCDVFFKLITKRYDAIYITPSLPGIGFFKDSIFVILSKIFCANIILHLHVQGYKKACKNKLYKVIYSLVFKNTKVIHLSPLLYEDISGLVDDRYVYFLGNGAENLFEWRDRARGLKCNTSITVLFFSNLLEFKGPLVLLKALSYIKSNTKHNIFIQFVGEWHDPDFKNVFFDYLLEHELSDVVSVRTGIRGDSRKEFFNTADVFVLPTKYEAYPLVLLEAMSCGLPIISTFEGAIPSIIKQNENGILVNKDDHKALAHALLKLIENESLRIAISNNNRVKYLENYSVESFEIRLTSLLEEIVS